MEERFEAEWEQAARTRLGAGPQVLVAPPLVGPAAHRPVAG